MQSSVNKTLRCFVCDNTVTDKCISLLSSKTPLTKVWLPNKIGSIVGDGYAVYVNYDDALCISCWNLFKQLDSYENNCEVLKQTILKHLRKKYSAEFQKDNDQTKRDFYVRTEEFELKKRKADPIFKCSECEFKNYDMNVVKTHVMECKKMTNCKYCNVRVSSKNLAKHCSDMHGSFVCKVCNFRAADRVSLNNHLKINHALNPDDTRNQFSCNACDYKTDSAEKLSAHKQNHGKIFKCNHCSQHYESIEAIQEHTKQHKKVTIYKCGTCFASYKDRDQLMEHIVTHAKRKAAEAHNEPTTHHTVPMTQQQEPTLMISDSATDLESILEKFNSGSSVNVVAVSTTNVQGTTTTLTDSQTLIENTGNLVGEELITDDNTESQPGDIAYKCQMCNEIFSTSNDYQLHVITACHGQIELNIDDENSNIKLITNDNGRKQLLMPNGQILEITDADGVFDTADVMTQEATDQMQEQVTEQQEEALLAGGTGDSAEEHSQEALDMVSINDDQEVADVAEVANNNEEQQTNAPDETTAQASDLVENGVEEPNTVEESTQKTDISSKLMEIDDDNLVDEDQQNIEAND